MDSEYIFITPKEMNFDTPICQYMDLDYLIGLLENKRYFVRARQEFEDVHERSWISPLSFAVHDAHSEVTRSQIEDDLTVVKEQTDIFNASKTLFTSCWSLDTSDRFLMWKAYTSKFGVRISSTIRKVARAIDSDKYQMICGKIEYNGHQFGSDNVIFCKDRQFKDEKEFRFYYSPKNTENSQKKDSLRLPVSPEIMIDSVILSPFISPSYARHLRNYLHDTYGINVIEPHL